MYRRTACFILLIGLISGCSLSQQPIDNVNESASAATPASTHTSQPEVRPPEQDQPTSTVAASPTSQISDPLVAFDVATISPGQEMAYTFQSTTGEEIQYWLYIPESYDASRSWPLIIALHGFLGFEPSLERVREQSPPIFVSSETEFPFIVLSPKGPDGPWELYNEPIEQLVELLGESLAIDPEAQFLAGLSTGAIGAWQWALTTPDRFTGLVLVAGNPSSPQSPFDPDRACLLRDLPIWIGQSEADERVSLEPTKIAVKALEDCGSSTISLTVYSSLSHSESFAAAFGGPELYDWMLAQVD
jgi:predicted peptidase